MKRTFVRIEKENGYPLEIVVNDRRLANRFERVTFFLAVALAAVAILLLLVYVVLPLLGIALGLIFGVIAIVLLIIGGGVAIALIGGLVGGVLESRSKGRQREDDWY